MVVCSAVLGIAVVAFLTLGTYTRRATVTGQLVPSAGVIRVHTPQAGVVLEKNVAEGQLVKKGDVLYVLSSDRQGSGSREIQADIGQQVDERRRSLQAEIERNRLAEAGEISHLERRAATLRSEGQAIQNQIAQQRIRLKLAEDARKRYQGLADQDYIAREQLFQKEAELTEQQSRLQALERDALVSQRELSTTVREIENTRVRYVNQNALLQRSISSTQQELTEVEAKRRVVITAPEAGRATLVAAAALPLSVLPAKYRDALVAAGGSTTFSGIRWRMTEAGNRTNEVTSDGNRIVLGATGTIAGWDYDTALTRAENKAVDRYVNGYTLFDKIDAGVRSGLINPFGPSSQAGLDYINANKVNDEARKSVGSTTGIIKAAKELPDSTAATTSSQGSYSRLETVCHSSRSRAAIASSSRWY